MLPVLVLDLYMAAECGFADCALHVARVMGRLCLGGSDVQAPPEIMQCLMYTDVHHGLGLYFIPSRRSKDSNTVKQEGVVVQHLEME